ncbi:MAG: alpha/beta hydrolase [Thiobacillaceae bacterium]|nr:alpha/beta hydrolase [Thiobacillaceae bacterium]
MKHQRLRIKRPEGGVVEALVEVPDAERAGLALIAHPHPLHGGTLDNKVVYTLSRAALANGYVAVRPNFRGVGASDGEFDHGQGETDDLLAVAAAVGAHYPGVAWSLLGFSFGAYVQQRVARRLPAERLIMVGPAVTMYPFEPSPIRADIVHGELDELVPLAAVEDYARRHAIRLHVIAGADHFFHGRLVELRRLVTDLCRR